MTTCGAHARTTKGGPDKVAHDHLDPNVSSAPLGNGGHGLAAQMPLEGPLAWHGSRYRLRMAHPSDIPGSHSAWLSRLPKGVRRHHGAGEVICRPETRSNRFFVLDAGLARICLNAASKELVIGYLRPGGLYVTHTRAWVEALDPCEVVSWPVEEMLGLVTREPELGATAFREIGSLLNGALSLIEDLAFRSVESRLARFLLAEAQAQGGNRIRLVEPTEALANALGTSRQTLSTLLNRLIREGVIARPDRRHLLLLCPDRLRDLSELSSG